MKKVFLIFGIAGCLSLVNGINNAHAVSDNPVITFTYTCPGNCTLQFIDTVGGISAQCVRVYMNSDDPTDSWNGTIIPCGDPNITTGTTNAAVNLNDYNIVGIPKNASLIDEKNIKRQKLNNVSVRSAETPKMVKKIVYEVVADEE